MPSWSIGFCVAITRNGGSSVCVIPSTVTRPSAIASNSDDWVRGVARLISSASTIWAKMGPGRNSNSAVFWLKIEAPVTSVGSRSGVHWTRLNEQPTLLARVRARMVLATPGTSSKRMCPSQNHETSDKMICRRFPTITFSTLAMIFFAVAITSIMGGLEFSKALGKEGGRGIFFHASRRSEAYVPKKTPRSPLLLPISQSRR